MKKIILCVAMAFMFFCGSSAAILMENGSGRTATAATEENEEAVYEQSMMADIQMYSRSNKTYVATLTQYPSTIEVTFRYLSCNNNEGKNITKNDPLVIYDNTIFSYERFSSNSFKGNNYTLFSPIKFTEGNMIKILSSDFHESSSYEDGLTLSIKNKDWLTTTITIMGTEIELTNPIPCEGVRTEPSPAKTLNDMDIDGNGVCDARDASLLLRFYTLASSMGDNERPLTDEDVPYFLEHNILIGMD